MSRTKPSMVKIVCANAGSHHAKVTVDGVEQIDLNRVDLKIEVGAINMVTLHRIGPAVDFEGLAEVVHVPPTLEDRVRRALGRVRSGDASMRIPADPNDPDMVLADVLEVLELARGPKVGR